MSEAAGALFRCVQLASNMVLLGGCVFLAIVWREQPLLHHPRLIRFERTLPWLAVILLLGLLGLLAATTATATGIVDNIWRPAAWLDFVQKTRIGFIWTIRAACALAVLGAALYVRILPRARWRYILCAIVAAVTLATGSFASHSAAESQSVAAILPYALHLVLASLWFGALPGVLAVVASSTLKRPDESTGEPGLQTLRRFSAMALPVMVGIVTTGIVVADRMVDASYAALVATTYGWLLNAKLALLAVILSIAARAHFVWVPALTGDTGTAETGRQGLRKWLIVEFALASVIVVVATLLANAVPAKHVAIDYWPYPFRFSIDANWGDWLVRVLVLTGVALLASAAGLVALGRTKRWNKTRGIVLPAGLATFALFLILFPLAVQSYPETYRKTPVPFDAISIANGMTIFAENCVPCHGPQAKGNGILAKTLPRQPIDLLTEPHTAMHTAGDFFHWLTYGRFDGVMPAFGDKFSEEDRWDLLNFLHANSRGYQARLINPRVTPNQPYLAPQNFSYSAHDGSSGTLKDFRQQKALLLVLFTWPESRARLDQLRVSIAQINDSGATVLAVPVNEPRPEELTAMTADLPFPVVTQGAAEIARSYSLFRRTRTNPDLFGAGTIPKHMELLIDRYGFLRARWIPELDGEGWNDVNLLIQQLTQLHREREILPPPGDHVH
ncbi:MAG TPA: CopD family protein [Nitrospira sp.]|nr:CopD family protein [Nitrospira sp.]